LIENILADIYRRIRRKRVAILISGDIITDTILNSLPILRDKIKEEVGDLKIAEIINDHTLTSEYFDNIVQSGFTSRIIPTHLELGFLLEVYDIVLTNKADLLILGTKSRSLIPLFQEIKKDISLFIVTENQKINQALSESFDGVIQLDDLENFRFDDQDLAPLLEDNVPMLISPKLVHSQPSANIYDLANIGTTSDVLINGK
jgi:hypothetical protein